MRPTFVPNFSPWDSRLQPKVAHAGRDKEVSMPTATGTFEITGMHEDPWHQEDDGPRLTHAGGTQRFSGDLTGDGAVEWLACYVDGGARLVGLQRIDGKLADRDGSFVIEATSDHDGQQSSGSWRILDGTGSGELAGISGRGTFSAAGGRTVNYRLDYELG
jgi:Protein of unknown function (DUF3224)